MARSSSFDGFWPKEERIVRSSSTSTPPLSSWRGGCIRYVWGGGHGLNTKYFPCNAVQVGAERNTPSAKPPTGGARPRCLIKESKELLTFNHFGIDSPLKHAPRLFL